MITPAAGNTYQDTMIIDTGKTYQDTEMDIGQLQNNKNITLGLWRRAYSKGNIPGERKINNTRKKTLFENKRPTKKNREAHSRISKHSQKINTMKKCIPAADLCPTTK